MVWLHPLRFREQYGEEMLCIFEESAPGEAPRLFFDSFFSLTRQWLLRSRAWKLVAGTVISSLLLFGWAYSLKLHAVSWSLRPEGLEVQAILDPPKRVSVLDRNAFSREAAEAVGILARLRRAEARRRRSDHQSRTTHTNGTQANED
jgi:hypothetical protein